MKIAIMQPYFFPYLGYFGLIKNTDRWIVFDTPQFIYHGWIERNRVIKPVDGWQYINVPLKKHSRVTSIKDIEIRNTEKWEELILAKLTVYKNIAPNYKVVIDLLNNVFSKKAEHICKLNCIILESICQFLDIKWNYNIYSEMDLLVDKVNAPDEWALNICKAIGGVTEYWNLPGGKDFFYTKKYTDNNITIRFFKQNLQSYNQNRKYFEPGLSIIDILMFCSSEEINEMLNNYEFI